MVCKRLEAVGEVAAVGLWVMKVRIMLVFDTALGDQLEWGSFSCTHSILGPMVLSQFH
jgi:hypothetical protein